MLRFIDIPVQWGAVCRKARGWLRGGIAVCLLLGLSSVVGDRGCAQELCDDARKHLRQEQRLLDDYLSALQESYENKDKKLAGVLNFKISQSRKRLHELELILTYCPSKESSRSQEGLSGAKSDDGRFADKSCGELRKMLFSLLVSKRALKRREKSMFSKLTDEEEAELLDVSDQLRHVRKALRSRCSKGKPPRSLLKRLRR